MQESERTLIVFIWMEEVMELTKMIKEKAAKAEKREPSKELIEGNRTELAEEEADMASGGADFDFICPECRRPIAFCSCGKP